MCRYTKPSPSVILFLEPMVWAYGLYPQPPYYERAGGEATMMDPASRSITQKRADYSTLEGFSFGFFCDVCAKEWRSAVYHLNSGNFAVPIDPTVFQMLWNEQHRAASERANLDASFEFNRCPVCGRWVCKSCFYVSEAGISDICKECLHLTTKACTRKNAG